MAKEIKLKEKSLGIFLRDFINVRFCSYISEFFEKNKKSGLRSLFDQISEEYETYGYQMPRLVFWNVYSRTNTIPLQQNEAGVALVSGFNPTVYQMVLSDELDPYRCLLQQLNAKRYDAVEQALGKKRG